MTTRTASTSLLHAIDQAEPIAVILYPDTGVRAELIEEIEDLRPLDWQRITDPSDLFAAPDRPTLLLPPDEAGCVRLIEGRREQLLDRKGPILLFLLRGGSGLEALTDSPALKSWVIGKEVDPEALATIDPKAARSEFETQHGQTPEEWLADWRAGRLRETTSNHAIAHWALLLEQ